MTTKTAKKRKHAYVCVCSHSLVRSQLADCRLFVQLARWLEVANNRTSTHLAKVRNEKKKRKIHCRSWTRRPSPIHPYLGYILSEHAQHQIFYTVSHVHTTGWVCVFMYENQWAKWKCFQWETGAGTRTHAIPKIFTNFPRKKIKNKKNSTRTQDRLSVTDLASHTRCTMAVIGAKWQKMKTRDCFAAGEMPRNDMKSTQKTLQSRNMCAIDSSQPQHQTNARLYRICTSSPFSHACKNHFSHVFMSPQLSTPRNLLSK